MFFAPRCPRRRLVEGRLGDCMAEPGMPHRRHLRRFRLSSVNHPTPLTPHIAALARPIIAIAQLVGTNKAAAKNRKKPSSKGHGNENPPLQQPNIETTEHRKKPKRTACIASGPPRRLAPSLSQRAKRMRAAPENGPAIVSDIPRTNRLKNFAKKVSDLCPMAAIESPLLMQYFVFVVAIGTTCS